MYLWLIWICFLIVFTFVLSFFLVNPVKGQNLFHRIAHRPSKNRWPRTESSRNLTAVHTEQQNSKKNQCFSLSFSDIKSASIKHGFNKIGRHFLTNHHLLIIRKMALYWQQQKFDKIEEKWKNIHFGRLEFSSPSSRHLQFRQRVMFKSAEETEHSSILPRKPLFGKGSNVLAISLDEFVRIHSNFDVTNLVEFDQL